MKVIKSMGFEWLLDDGIPNNKIYAMSKDEARRYLDKLSHKNED